MPETPPYAIEEEIESDLDVEVGSRPESTESAPDGIEEMIEEEVWEGPVFFNNGKQVELPPTEIEELLDGDPPSP